MDLASTAFALLAGLLFGLAVHLQRAGLQDTDDLTGSFISVATMATVFWIGAITQIDAAWWSTRAALLFAICGLVWPAMGQRLQIASVVHAGPAITSAVGSFTSLFAILPAMVLLDDASLAFLFCPQVYPIHPSVKSFLSSASRVIGIENNQRGQYADLVQFETGVEIKTRILKYSGMPFSVEELAVKIGGAL